KAAAVWVFIIFFFSQENLLTFGIFFAFIAVMRIASNLFSGKYSDIGHEKRVLNFSSGFLFIATLGKIFTPDLKFALFINSFEAIGMALIFPFLDAMAYRFHRKQKDLAFSVALNEWLNDLGSFLTCILIAILLFIGIPLQKVLIIGLIGIFILYVTLNKNIALSKKLS
ncbi:hypothetical protein ACFL08_04930, partial [Patescibacteria group bacterium]